MPADQPPKAAAGAQPPNDAQAAFDWRAALVEHESWLRLVVMARLGEPQAVPDVMQDVAAAAAAGAAKLRDPDRASAWLYRLAVNAALEYRRKAGRRRKRIEAYRNQHAREPRESPDPLEWLLAEETRQLVRRAVAALPPRDAELLLLKYTQDWTYTELAQRLGVSEPAVVGRLHRARAKLRSELRREDPTLGRHARVGEGEQPTTAGA